MKKVRSFQTSEATRLTTRRNTAAEQKVPLLHCENLRTHKIVTVSQPSASVDLVQRSQPAVNDIHLSACYVKSCSIQLSLHLSSKQGGIVLCSSSLQFDVLQSSISLDCLVGKDATVIGDVTIHSPNDIASHP